MVVDFHKAFDIQINNKPTVNVDKNVPILRCNLIQEELEEFNKAILDENLIEIADALGDLLYVIYGAAVSYRIDLEDIFTEIHRSNMTKVGRHKREDGKYIKPDTYDPPNILNLLIKQGMK